MIGVLFKEHHQLIEARAWPLARNDYTAQEIAALAYLRGLSDAAESLRDSDTHPKDGAAPKIAAPLVSGAGPKDIAQKEYPNG